MLLNEIGLECEYFLLDDKGEVLEAPKYNFPADEIGFLIEITSLWGDNPRAIVNSLHDAKWFCREKAERLGFRLEEIPYKYVSPEWMEYIREKNHEAMMADFTQNIYGTKDTAHTGCREDEDGLFVTSGLHVHFSRFDTDSEEHIPFTMSEIRRIVRQLDFHYKDELVRGKRIAGEWESKFHGDDTKRAHGFEYRGLPCDVDKFDVADYCLQLLNDM